MKKKLLLMALFAMFSFSSFAQVEANPVPDLVQCNDELFDLTVQTVITLGDQDAETHSVTYHLSEADAQAGTNALTNISEFVPNEWPDEVFIRVEDENGNFEITSFAVTVLTTPWFPEFDDVMVCGSYQLPGLQSGNYYTGPGGTGDILEPGTVLTVSTTVYVYESNDCGTEEASFEVTINEGSVNTTDLAPLKVCDPTFTGTAIFDLQPSIQQIQDMNETEVTVTVHETYEDAVYNMNPLPNVSAYANIAPWMQIVYLRVQSGECVVVLPLELHAISCPSEFTLSGYVKFDADGDGCSDNDLPASNVMVYYMSGDVYNYTYTDEYGFYIFHYVPSTPLTLYAETLYPMVSNSFPEFYTLEINESVADANFCLSVAEDVTDVSVYLVETSAAQPGFPATYALIYQNNGSTVASGNITVEFNDTQLDFVATNSPDVVPSGTNAITMNYSDLQPFSYQIVELEFLVAMPGVVDLGDTITFTSTITPIEGDAYPENNVNVLNQISVNSWDPNDIMVYEGEEITLEQADDYLTYRIRFQNEGDANAINIKVASMLHDDLDFETFQPIMASHDYVVNRTGNNIEFYFENIQLPWEYTNEPESHGYIIYRIKPRQGVEVGDIMTANAGIYFDFNPAINTNTASTEIVEMAGLEENALNNFTIYPNPASSSLTIDFADETVEAYNVVITDALGKTVLKGSYNTVRADINISSLGSGMYFVTTSTNGKKATKKLIIK